ncbi:MULTISPECIES: histidine phosphatase family protein [Mumia]|uniref:histidine phosphatase family protein n=1 Tax=Mumia TaxID=1546255 RepID=UPI0014212824|nr:MULTISPECIES: histidine phosphatase family protein [unclassified Mumia]QMW67278.1 histidine phosphatase family protein [Mumia sp. ZJ1417]
MPAQLWMVRHGPTEWARNGRHTSHTDLPLLPDGEERARDLLPRLAGTSFALVLTSPRMRARRTAELAGFPDAVVVPELAEWDYGAYEGLTTPQIREDVPGWTTWTHGAGEVGGETADEVAARLDRVVARVRAEDGPVLVFGHGHALRALAARYLGEPVRFGARLALDTATLSVLGYEHDTDPVIERWNC